MTIRFKHRYSCSSPLCPIFQAMTERGVGQEKVNPSLLLLLFVRHLLLIILLCVLINE